MKKIAILASGSGTNAENIINYFKNNHNITIEIVLSNKKEALVLDRAKQHGISAMAFSRASFYEKTHVLDLLKSINPDVIVLAGFLWKMPENIITSFPDKIINIHPALLPKYGGKGMYGMNVHQAVIENKEQESGITIHYINEEYDEGAIIFQARIKVLPRQTPEELAQAIHQLEYEHFPKIIARVLNG
ncbi:phosphoribosylglycinamide formyltransferase [Zhouia sp. PK063]|uniref:phosphoribosylglycinamide formyltransferase n=1 Tax=Zhouia sp. PK063 TaxID=3373602 RepID=UPI00378AE036